MIGSIVLDRYEIDAFIADGGMGRVYRARHKRLGTHVAVKVLGVDAEQHRERMEREALVAARVRHPNVVGVLDYGELDDGRPCLVMEYATGTPLDAVVAENGAMTWQDGTLLMVYVLAGLEAIHDADITHRDMKPSNVIVDPAGPMKTKVIDFGIALQSTSASADFADDDRLTSPGFIIGTPVYLAPEQLMGDDVAPAADIYSLGLVFAECLTGRSIRQGRSIELALKESQRAIGSLRPPDGLPPIPEQLDAAIRAMTRFSPGDRPTTREAAAALRSVLADEGGAVLRNPSFSDGFEVPTHEALENAPPAELAFMATTENPSDPSGLETVPAEADAGPEPRTPSGSFDREITNIRRESETNPRLVQGDAVLVATVRDGVLERDEELRWLAQIARLVGHAFRWNDGQWCAYLRSDTGLSTRLTYAALSDLLRDRYADALVELAWVDVPATMKVSTGQFEDASAPHSLVELLEVAPRKVTWGNGARTVRHRSDPLG